MSAFVQIRESVVSLSKPERAVIADSLLGSLEGTHHWIDDEEVEHKFAELHSGEFAGVTKEEFKKICARQSA